MDTVVMKCLIRLFILFYCVEKSWCGYCYYQSSTYTYTRCWIWPFRCRDGNRYTQHSRCCDGWTGTSCNTPICASLTGSSACTRKEGYVKESASGPIHTWSGGTCVAPEACASCNNGYYPAGPQCRACPALANCYYTSCTDPRNRVCNYCKGVVKDDPNQYGWWAFTRWKDDGQSCKAACSWRSGSRCYPGSCSRKTLDTCICADGFTGRDCATITDKPTILQSAATIKQVTDTSVETVDGPIDTASPSPQETVWTNNVLLHSASASVDAQYVKALPDLPRNDFYINKDKSIVGIVSGGVSFELQRANVMMSNGFTHSCNLPVPKPNNFRCEGNFDFRDNWLSYLPFKHSDRIIFKTFATNGGYITTYDRENDNTEVRYNMVTNNIINMYYFGFDTEPPSQCKMNICDTEPLQVPDGSTHAVFITTWGGWNDLISGLKCYQSEIFHLRPTGPDIDSELIHGDKVSDSVTEDTTISVTLPSPGPYSMMLTAVDKAGNHRTARRVMVFDDTSVVQLQGEQSHASDIIVTCSSLIVPSAPVVTNAEPLSNCDWITHPTSVVKISWKHRFINKRHHVGQWLNEVANLDNVLDVLDDHEGKRQIERKTNVLGIVRFEVSYNVTFENSITNFPFMETDDVSAETAEITENMVDGKRLTITIRAFDIVDTFIDDHITIKSDTSSPVIENLWLTRGNHKNLAVHNTQELDKLTIEWETYDYHSGIYEVKWRLYDNYTGDDIVHGESYEPPQGQIENREHCEQIYGLYPRGAGCYCTPFDGCFHKHFQLKPVVVTDNSSGIIRGKHIGDHDSDYFIKVNVTNKAMLTSSVTKKITIDTTPPVAGSVQEGMSGSPDIDFQQDSVVHVHWSGFFDEESGVWFYKYGYGKNCLTKDDFDIDINDEPIQTYNKYASFVVPSGETYYVTVVAYNRALDHSEPACSDGITIDASVPEVCEVLIHGARTKHRIIQTEDDIIWYLHADRRVQMVDKPSERCRSNAIVLPNVLFSTLPKWTDSVGRIKNTTNAICESLKNVHSDLIGVLTSVTTIDISWIVQTPDVHMHDFKVGLSSTNSIYPDIMPYKSSNRHHHISIDGSSLVDGQRFFIVIKTISKSNKINRQAIGPFVLDRTPPKFQGNIKVKYNDSTFIAEWASDTITDEEDPDGLTFEYAVGNSPYGVDVHPFTPVTPGGLCVSTEPPTCTTIDVTDLAWSLHDKHTYYVTIKATNTGGQSVLATSLPYVHDAKLPSKGVVLDVDATEQTHTLGDIDFQTSLSSMTAAWHGFSVPSLEVKYTACVAENSVIKTATCKDVGDDTKATLNDLNLSYFTTYQFAVLARSNGGSITVLSDGVMTIDTNMTLDGIQLYDGQRCEPNTDSSNIRLAHHDTDITTKCMEDISYQASLNSLILHWNISEKYKAFTPDVYWHIQERAPVADYWTSVSEREHVTSSVVQISTSYLLQTGRTYRFAVEFCAHMSCFPELSSDGVTVIHNPPKVGSFVLNYLETDMTIQVTFGKFYDGDIEDIKEAQAAIDHYEYTITDNGHADKTVTIWTRIKDLESVNDNEISFSIKFETAIQFTTCWKLAIRGYNKAGLYNVVSGEIRSCKDKTLVRDPIVIDAVGQDTLQSDGSVRVLPFDFINTEVWADDDKDYTPVANIVSAVWPTLRYPSYSWAILEHRTVDSILYYNEILTIDLVDPCDTPESIKCGNTSEKFINIEMESGELTNGKRYVVCIHSNSTVLHHALWEEQLPEISVCSDGVTVDLTPPTPGDVWIAQKHAEFQTSLTDLAIYWDNFEDIEELHNAFHSTGIMKYEVAVGSHHGDIDVMDYRDVGVVNHVTLHELKLQNGHKYYAIIRGTDFTGRYTTSISSPIIVDDTPPVASDASINIGSRHITDRNAISPCWTGLFSDAESSIVLYQWSIGSRPGYDDIYTYTASQLECVQVVENDMTDLQEGHVYFVSVLATNGAGLSAMSTSWGFVVDFSPPIVGYVYDGQLRDTDKPTDIDYQTGIHTLTAQWKGFIDQHTNIQEYFVKIGTKKYVDNIIKSRTVGLSQEISIEHLELTEGFTYYVTVTACNTAGMCSSVSSDGVMVDSSPPIPGRVNDGTDYNDRQYQHSSTFVGVKWSSFVDAQSGISHYTWRLGSVSGGDDILATRNVHTNDIAMEANLVNNLPKHKRLFSTIRAYNKAGMWSESSSNGLTVDDTVPVVVTPLTHVSIGSILPSTSILKSVMKFTWKIEDEESFIERQYMSIIPHIGEDFNMTIELPGYIRDYTFTGLSLHDGSLYDVTLIACNGASVCVESVLHGLLVDSTPPIAGTFAINTDHAADLERQTDVWMIWDPVSLHLAWLGFSDEHSSITSYMVNVGSDYMGADLNEVPHSAYQIPHNASTHHEADEGIVQVFNIPTQPLTEYEHVFVTIYAVNGVGLRSNIVHSQFTLIPGGDMELVRRCSGYSGEGHCAFTSRDRKCPLSIPCNNVTGDTSYASVNVKDLIYLSGDTAKDSLTSISPVNTLLSASWETTSINVIMPKWYEWSIGLSSYTYPSGLLSSIGSTWHDAARTNILHYTLQSDETLHDGETYSVFVRAWFSGTTFAEYKSDGVTIMSSHPGTSNIFGISVKEVLNDVTKDVDYIPTTNGISIDWTGTFNTNIWKYKVYLSSYPGGHDLHMFEADLSGDTTNVNITLQDTQLQAGVKYYSNVQAYNQAGLHTSSTSDGFILDLDEPTTGMVIDGSGMSDLQYQNSSMSISARWYGFTDLTSSIRSYHWCVSTIDSPGSCNVVPAIDVGRKIAITKQLESAMGNGKQVINQIQAKDMVGHLSEPVTSNGVVIDITPPAPQRVENIKQNIILNPSFETYSALNYILLDNFDIARDCNKTNRVEGWKTEGCTAVVVSGVHNVQDGQAFIWTSGSINHTLYNLVVGKMYRLTLYVSHLTTTTTNIQLNAEGFVKVDDDKHLFLIHSKPGRPNSIKTISWQLVTYYFAMTKSTATVTIGSVAGSYGIIIDNVQFQEMTHSTVDDLTTNHVSSRTVFIHDWSSIHASWKFDDPESGIKEYMWAIGTVKGGTQLQEFKTVGTRLFGINSELHLPHLSSIYITVVGTNGAGYKAVSYSDQTLVDLTPPELLYVNDGMQDNIDIDFQSTSIVYVNFAATDVESGILSCSWGIGTYPGDVSIMEFTSIPTGQTATYDATDKIAADSKLFTSIRCTNNAGLTTTKSSDGVQILLHKPSIAVVNVDVLEMSDTQYPVHDNYHGRADQLRVRWSGFDTHAWVDLYQVQLKGNSFNQTVLVHDQTPGYIYATFDDLNLTDGQYTVSVTGVNKLDVESEQVMTNVTILTAKPAINYDTGVEINWDSALEEATVTWSGVFTSTYPLYYEVSVGHSAGSVDIVQWQETRSEQLKFTLNADTVGQFDVDIYVVVRAITPSGMYATAIKHTILN